MLGLGTSVSLSILFSYYESTSASEFSGQTPIGFQFFLVITFKHILVHSLPALYFQFFLVITPIEKEDEKLREIPRPSFNSF